ncbi:MAG: DnaJ domain-containing protein [Rhodoglobus sp.]
METPNHYELLGVAPDASPEEIHAAHQRLTSIHHPNVAGVAGVAMTLRLDEAQRVLLDPELRSRFDRQGSRSGQTYSVPAALEPVGDAPPSFRRDTIHRPVGDSSLVVERSALWNTLAFLSIAVIVATTGGVLTTTYAGSMAEVSPRLIPPIILALVWAAARLSRPPRLVFGLLGVSVLFWPIAAAGVWPVTFIVSASPDWLWALLAASFVATIVLRIAGPRMTRFRHQPPAAGWSSAAWR